MTNLPDANSSRLAGSLPQVPAKTFSDGLIQYVADLVLEGRTPGAIARRLARKAGHRVDARSIKHWRRILRTMSRDERFQAIIMDQSQADVVAALPKAIAGASREAAGGNIQAVKWIGEASGFHNPRVDHNHSGDIQISLNLPRAGQPELEEPVVEAEVVED